MEIYLILELIIIKVGLLLSVKGLVVDLAGYYYWGKCFKEKEVEFNVLFWI